MEKLSCTYTLETIQEPLDILTKLFPLCSVFTFAGSLGAGKTTLIRALLKKCGVTDTIVSPTFTYIVTYTNTRGEKFYHFDLYRITTMAEFLHEGFDELLYTPNSWSFIEWPELIMPLIDHRACYVSLRYTGQDQRVLEYSLSTDLS